ncbi:MAG: tyrosine-type recombinase/integrase [Hyphomicrobiaceae bacterium]
MKLAPSTQSEYRRLLRAVEDVFGSVPLEVFSDKKDAKRARRRLLEWRDKLAAEDKLREAENRLTVLQRVMSWAVDRGTIEINPLDTWERHYKADRADKIWTPHHVEAFVEKASPEMRLAIYLALYTGQRQGDLLKLTWPQYRDGNLYIRQGKGNRHVEVPCIERVRAMLDDIRARPVQSTHILTTANSRRWLKRHFSRQFKDTCDRAGIVGLTFHDLRGTAVTLLAEADLPLLVGTRAAGNASNKIDRISCLRCIAVSMR